MRSRFMLCFVVLRAAVSTMNAPTQEYFGLAIGFVIVAGGPARPGHGSLASVG